MHACELRFLFDWYQIPAEKIGNLSAGFRDPTIQVLSSSLEEQGNLSFNDDLEAGVMIERQNISDLNRTSANTTREDLKMVLEIFEMVQKTVLVRFPDKSLNFLSIQYVLS